MMLKLIILIVIAAGAAPFFINGPNDEPLMTLDDWKIELPTSASDLLPGSEPPTAAPTITEVYKWQDGNGVWQFSNRPGDAEVDAEVVELDGNINTYEAFKAPPPQTTATESKATSAAIPGVSTISPSQAGELLDTVKNLQGTIDQRKADLDTITGMQK